MKEFVIFFKVIFFSNLLKKNFLLDHCSNIADIKIHLHMKYLWNIFLIIFKYIIENKIFYIHNFLYISKFPIHIIIISLSFRF